MIEALLEPVRQIIEARKILLDQKRLYDAITSELRRFDALVREVHRGQLSQAGYRNLQRSSIALYQLLLVGSQNLPRPSLRRVLEDEYVHEPLRLLQGAIESVMQRALALGGEILATDFVVRAREQAGERHLICCERQDVLTIFRDLLTDVRHVKEKGRMIRGVSAFMSIDGRSANGEYSILFETSGTEADVAAARAGGTLRSVRSLIHGHEGRVECQFDSRRGVLQKVVTFPLYRQRN